MKPIISLAEAWYIRNFIELHIKEQYEKSKKMLIAYFNIYGNKPTSAIYRYVDEETINSLL